MLWVAASNAMFTLDGGKIMDWDATTRTYTDSNGRTFVEAMVQRVPGDGGNGDRILQAFWRAADQYWQS